ncbi:MAG: twin-arginine translocation signal domain-containing protein [Methanonatronarchaeia archaeon]|nr:MAG: twin-arginine translocation signal domain-containing protein [Methanonatronarchaeia archaeon]
MSKGSKEIITDDEAGTSRRSLLKAIAVGGVAAAVGVYAGYSLAPEPEEPTPPDNDNDNDVDDPDPIDPLDEYPDGPLAGHMLYFDYQRCTGCYICVEACAEKFMEEFAPEDYEDGYFNPAYSRMEVTRGVFVDAPNTCRYCKLEPWAEGTDEKPCEAVCPYDAIVQVPEGEGEEGLYGMGYYRVDRDACIGFEDCGAICLEICEEQFGSGITFDPDGIAQMCTRCGGMPECVTACPETRTGRDPTARAGGGPAIEFTPVQTRERFYAYTPDEIHQMLHTKLYSVEFADFLNVEEDWF